MPSIKDYGMGGQWNANGGPVYQLPDFMKNEYWKQNNPVNPDTSVGIPYGNDMLTNAQSQVKQSENAGNLAPALTSPQTQNPSLTPPVGVPQNNGRTNITIPEMYRQNNNGTFPPLTIRNGITMPSASPGVKLQSFPSMNWADFLTVANNRQTR